MVDIYCSPAHHNSHEQSGSKTCVESRLQCHEHRRKGYLTPRTPYKLHEQNVRSKTLELNWPPLDSLAGAHLPPATPQMHGGSLQQ